jgi:hypothetical protein
MEYNFPKALYRYKELLEVLPVSSSTVDRWKAELKKANRDLRDMGCYQLKGCKYDMWNPVELILFIEQEKIQLRVGRPKKQLYDYELLEQEKLNHVLTVVNTNHKRGVN